MSDSDGDNLRSRTRASPLKALIVALIIMAAVAGIVSAVTDGVDVSGDITLNAPSGPEVTFADQSGQANLTYPFDGANTVNWTADNGNMTVSGDSSASLTVENIEGTWTNTTDSNGGKVTLNPADKERVTIEGAESVNWTTVTVDDGNPDFTINGSGTAEVTFYNLPQGKNIVAINESGDFIGGGTSNPIGEANITLSLSSHTVQLNTTDNDTTGPAIQNPRPEGAQNDFPTTLKVNISDPDFPNDVVTANFTHNGNDVGQDSLTSAGTASVTISSPPRGTNTVNVTATDSFGKSATFNYTFSTPENLTIRNAEDPDTIIDDRQVNVTFFAADNITERTTTNGRVSMDGLPVEDNIVVELESTDTSASNPDGYFDSESVVITFTEQTDVYMLPKNQSFNTYNITFELDDQTGGTFAENNPAIRIQRPINRSSYDRPRWEEIYGDDFGPDGTTARLREQQRYRVRVINDQGDERVAGKYVPDQRERVVLEIGSVGAAPQNPETNWAWNATYNADGQENIRFYYNDSVDRTDLIFITVFEFNNKSNVLVPNQSFSGPYGEFAINQPVPADQNETTWVVKATIVREDGTFVIREPVGPQQPVLPDLPPHLKIMISLGTLLIVAGLFSQLNGHIGGLVLAGLGGIFWFIDFLPPGVNIGMVVLAMVTAAVIFLRERADQGVTV